MDQVMQLTATFGQLNAAHRDQVLWLAEELLGWEQRFAYDDREATMPGERHPWPAGPRHRTRHTGP
jgi:hypothetical protein